MGQRRTRQTPVRLFFALMARHDALFVTCETMIHREFGHIDSQSEFWDFDAMSLYYAPEFGTGLRKRIISVEALIGPENLVEIKIRTNEMERILAATECRNEKNDGSPPRCINIDPGYLSNSKVVLATTKDYAHRLYMGRGIFEEVTLSYRRESDGFTPNPWTYADYRMETSLIFFNNLRKLYCRQLKA